jgi:hypothetical protein
MDAGFRLNYIFFTALLIMMNLQELGPASHSPSFVNY